jgi:hypothetical protein
MASSLRLPLEASLRSDLESERSRQSGLIRSGERSPRGSPGVQRIFERRSQPKRHGVKPRDPRDHEEGLAPCPSLEYSIRL